MKQEKSCGALIIDKSDASYKILLIQHKTGHWSFPKGHVEANETEHETASREVKEETGIDIDFLPDFRESISYSPARGVMKTVIYFLAKPLTYDCRPQLSELAATAWFSFEEAEKRITFPNDKSLFAKMKEYVARNNY